MGETHLISFHTEGDMGRGSSPGIWLPGSIWSRKCD